MTQNSIKVLLIEDDPSYSLFINKILTEEISLSVFEVTQAPTLDKGTQELSNGKFDLILLDTSFFENEEKRVEVFDQIKAISNKAPILILSDYQTKDLALNAMKHGAKEYFIKGQIDENTLPLVLIHTVKQNKSDEALKLSQKRFEVIMENSSDIITIVDSNGVIQYENSAVQRDLGFNLDEKLGKKVFEFIHPEDVEKAAEIFGDIIKNRDKSHSIELRMKHKDGSWRYLESIGRSILDDKGNPICVVNSRDITERIKFEDELRRLSLVDELTGLHNRRGFLTLVQQQMKLANRNHESIHVLFIDVDDMKFINDFYGHESGDKALQEVAKILKACFRDVDILSRLGGDEFAVVLIQAKESGIEVIKNRLQERVNVSNSETTNPFKLSISAGIVHYDPTNPYTIQELIAEADREMYKQKKSKKNHKSFNRNKVESEEEVTFKYPQR